LVSLYNQEKSTLKKELGREFMASEEKMLDSLLLTKVVSPFLHDKATSHFNMVYVADSGKIGINSRNWIENKNSKDTIVYRSFGAPGHKTNSIKIQIDSKTDDTLVTVNCKPDKSEIVVDSIKSVNFRDKFLLQSFKVLSSRVSDSSGKKSSFIMNFTTGYDSSILQREFKKSTLANNFKIKWIKNNSAQKEKSEIYFESNLLDNKVGVNVTQFSFYLFKQIFPQILFGLILIILTGAAFIISFVSLKNQMQLNIIRNEFISNISHELKTPVSTVKVALEALQSFNLKNEPIQADEYIIIAQIEMNRLDMLIQKVLTTSVYDEVNEIMQYEPLDLKNVLDEVVKSMQIKLTQIDALITISAENKDLTVFADKLHLQGVLINLIDNSIKYVDGKPTISIKIFKKEESTILTITDNGIGIPEEYLTKVFDKFFRVPTDNRHNVKGYGLGLSYAAMVMKHHNGSISVKNGVDQGCTFTLTFPKYS